VVAKRPELSRGKYGLWAPLAPKDALS
jgi:hypothetical protein